VATSAFLRTRVARRILLLFLLCAVLPLTVLAALGYRYLTMDLEHGARGRVRQESKTSGMMLLDRLNSLAALLQTVSTQIDSEVPLHKRTASHDATVAGPRFRALVLVGPDGRTTVVSGEAAPELPRLLPGQEEHLRRGGVAMVTAAGPGGLDVYLVRAMETMPGARLWGWIEAASVWGLDPSRSVAPVGTLLCLTTTAGQVLTCPEKEMALPDLVEPAGSSYRWRRDGVGYVTGQWTLFLTRLYATPSWTLSLSLPEEQVFAPLSTLRETFFLGLLLALATVFALSHVQLRRTMQPLEALEAGTRRLAMGRFDDPVRVSSDDEFAVLAQSFNRMAGDLGRQFRNQQALRQVHQAALGAPGPEAVLGAVFAGRADLLPGQDLTIALARPDDPSWWTVTDPPTGSQTSRTHDAQPGASELAELLSQPEGVVLRRGELARNYFSRPGEVLLHEVMVLPLLRNGVLAGALVVSCEPHQEGRPEALAEARREADQIAVSISNTQLVQQLDAMHWGALTALARTIDAASPWTAGHSERVTAGAMEIARLLGASRDDLDLLHRGGLLHDIGKIGVPTAILDKPGPLTPEEFAIVRSHPAIGARILAPVGAFRRALPLVLHHHEMLDGTGYPHGLKDEQIPLIVRILTVADVFDALVSDRPYRQAWPIEKALEYLRQGSNAKFDRRAVEALTKAVDSGWRPAASSGTAPSEPGEADRYDSAAARRAATRATSPIATAT
jgi:putative nucleotidyltransferase with HDIG domain